MDRANNVSALPGIVAPTAEPNIGLVQTLEDLLEQAKLGRLRSFIGTGFMIDGARLAVWGDHHSNVYAMLGSIAWLEHEYVHRHTDALGR